jgi:hypothetical protein
LKFDTVKIIGKHNLDKIQNLTKCMHVFQFFSLNSILHMNLTRQFVHLTLTYKHHQTITPVLYCSMIMLTFEPEKEHLRHSLLFLFNQKKKAVESHCLLVESYGEHIPSIRTCETWFRQFKSGDFNVKDKNAKMNCWHDWMMTQLKQQYR